MKNNHSISTHSHSGARRTILMLILLTAIWGLTFPATRAALRSTEPMTFLFLRFGLAVVILSITLAGRLQRLGLSGFSRLWSAGWLVGMLLTAGFVLQTWGLRGTTASRSGFFTGLLVVFTPLLARLFSTSRLRMLGWVGVILALVGVGLMAEPVSGGLNWGDWLTIAAAMSFAGQMVALEAAARKWGDALTMTLLQALMVMAGAGLWSAAQGLPIVISSSGWLALLYTGIFGGVVAVLLQTRYQPMVPAGYAAIIFTLEPIFAALFAYLILDETWTMRSLFGAGLILAAMGTSTLGLNGKGDKN